MADNGLYNLAMEDNRKLTESAKAQTEIIRALAKKITELESRARYKEEEIQELLHDIEFWKKGYKVMAALAEEYRKFIEEQNAQNRALMGGGISEHGRQ